MARARIRSQPPGLDDEGVEQELRQRFEIQRRLEEKNIYRPVGDGGSGELAVTGFESVVRLIDVLEHRAVDSMLVGSLSSSLYGMLRSTKDADFVLSPPVSRVGPFVKELGTGFRIEPQISFESLTGSIRRVIHGRTLDQADVPKAL